ncbi:hypothetical protein [Streptomyces sp. G-G2]|uniref:hypothetical protein n=1 Tax=Streptomyces sp. G-G2 TaxID=3046201 RepID=UPI0024BA69C6|nr:hypothetical protein [Streptomyces sp. G-G2]MDJ0385835.1 hypothetical protein [Streptomyces sp. G-G2]
MPAATPRPHVMALLFDTNFKTPSGSLVYRHLDGRLFTEEEQAIVRNATIEELQAAGVHVHDPEAGADAKAASYAMADLLLKYVRKHHEVLIPFMTHEDVLEYGRLATTIARGADRLLPYQD